MEARAKVPVSLPVPNPILSYWQDPPDTISDLRSSEELPPTADYVIVGSGISGACIAHNLLEKKPSAKVVMLEARQTCSGATGRNGGHTKAASYRSFIVNSSNHSIPEAVKIARLHAANIDATHAFARQHNIACDSHPCKTVDIALDQETYDFGVRSVKYMNEVASSNPGLPVHRILSKEEAREKYPCPGATGAFEYDAGSISAYKFVVGMLKLSLNKGLNLQTHTPVTRLEEPGAAAEQPAWRVHTPRGVIETSNVILATNGYTAAIWPQFQGVIVPLRGQITAQRPGRNMPALYTTYSFTYSSGYEYMIPRPPGSKFEGDIVIGGGWGKLSDAGAQEFGICDDGTMHDEVSGYLTDCTVEYFGKENWGEDAPEGRVRREWTGIMGNSADGLPYVGQVPGQRGLWASVSFDGHGMVLCLKCAEALVSMMVDGEAGEDELDEWFPRSFRLTQQRFEIAFKGRKLAKIPLDTLETRSHI